MFRSRLLPLSAIALASLAYAGPTRAQTLARQFAAQGKDPALLSASSKQGLRKGQVPLERLNRRALARVAVSLRPGASPEILGASYGLVPLQTFESDPSIVVFGGPSPEAVSARIPLMRRDPAVQAAFQVHTAPRERMQFVANDPYINKDKPVAGWSGQWHLRNQIGTGIDVRIDQAWYCFWIGRKVCIGIVDDGLEWTHPDLRPGYLGSNSWDFGGNDKDPMPVYEDDNHGTAVAGVAGARGANGIGGSGAAPFAWLAGLRVDFTNATEQMFADATMYRSNPTTHTIAIKNHSYGYSVPFIPSDLELAALRTSASAGTIHCFAAGNERGTAAQDANKQMLQASPDAITVAALGSDGKFAYYSDFGANVFVTAPSNSATGPGILTTDRMTEALGYNGAADSFPDANYTSQFGGTSSASPLAAGVLACAKSANFNMDVRLAKHLLVKSCDIVDASDATVASDGGWKTNGAGIKFNQNYGFGLINADKLTLNATQYSGVTALTTTTTGTVNVNAAIPDNDTTGATKMFSVNSTVPLEEVLVKLKITHAFRGDLDAYLTSPKGTTSRLFVKATGDGEANLDWTFCSNAFWGENPQGNWTLRVRDTEAQDTGTWVSYEVITRGGQLVAATPVDLGQNIDQAVPTQMKAGSKVTVSVKFRNTGNTIWTKAAGYALGSDPANNMIWGLKRVPLADSDAIRPGAPKKFNFQVTAPTTPGDYTFRWRMTHNDKYFNSGSVAVTVKVVP